MSEALPLMDEPPVLQRIEGLRAIHALIWDEQGKGESLAHVIDQNAIPRSLSGSSDGESITG
jgi:hypothetical protein